jgi:hypothetical protein
MKIIRRSLILCLCFGIFSAYLSASGPNDVALKGRAIQARRNAVL